MLVLEKVWNSVDRRAAMTGLWLVGNLGGRQAVLTVLTMDYRMVETRVVW